MRINLEFISYDEMYEWAAKVVGGAPAKTAAKADKADKADDKKNNDTKPEGPTKDDVKKIFAQAVDKFGDKEGDELIEYACMKAGNGAESLSKLKPEFYAPVIEFIQKKLDK